MTGETNSETTVSSLLNGLANDASSLVRQEVQLAAVEIAAKARTASRSGALVVLGGALAQAGFLILLAAIVVALQPILPMWVSSLFLAVVVIGAGYALIRGGITSFQNLEPVPQQTVGTLRANMVWAKELLR
jgi:hypothetical protein